MSKNKPAHKSGGAVRRPDVPEEVLAYWKRAAVPRRLEPREFEKSLRRFGQSGAQALAAVEERAAGRHADVYAHMYEDLELSLAFVGQYRGQLVRSFLTWWVRENVAPTSILDVGCGNGIITCFLAEKHPSAEVVGVDASETAVACARRLAERLGLSNVRFSVESLAALSAARTFETVLGVNILRDALGMFAPTRAFALDGFDWSEGSAAWRDALRGLVTSLHDDSSRLVNVERLHTVDDIARWASAMNEVGLEIDWNASFLVSDEDSSVQPLVVARRRAQPRVATPADVAGFVAYPDLVKREFAFVDASADAMRVSLRTDTVASFEIRFHSGDERVRVEVFRAGSLCGFWQASSNGSRRLDLFPSAALREVFVQRANAVAEAHTNAKLYLVRESAREVSLDEFVHEAGAVLQNL